MVPYPRSSICRDRMAANSSAKPSSRWACSVNLGRELVIENGRWYGGDKAECGRKQRFRRCPGATTARDVFLEAAIDWKLVMMPQTVPNRPDKWPGRADCRKHQEAPFKPLDLARDRHFHDLFDAHLQARRSCVRCLPSKLRFHSRIAATNNAAIECAGRDDSAR